MGPLLTSNHTGTQKEGQRGEARSKENEDAETRQEEVTQRQEREMITLANLAKKKWN